jgi:hypothetical protein
MNKNNPNTGNMLKKNRKHFLLSTFNYTLILLFVFCFFATNKITAQTSGTTGGCTWALSGSSPNYTLTSPSTNAVIARSAATSKPFNPFLLSIHK